MTTNPTPRTWLIDTAAGDLARPLAELALERGDRVVLTGTSPADLADLTDLADLADLADLGDRVRLVAREPGSAAAAVLAADGVDVLVTAAPATPDGDLPARLAAELDAAVLLQTALPELRRRGGALLHLAPAGGSWLEARHGELAALGVQATVAERGADRADPGRLARLLADVVTAGHAPRRLVLGAAALHRSRQALQGRLQELDVWERVSRAADAADAPVRVLDRGMAGVLHLAAPAA